MRKFWRKLLIALTLLVIFIFLNNTALLAPGMSGQPVLLAHRGIAQRFETEGLTNDTCTATRMLPPTHGFLENTIPSMRAGFDAGADVVELDIHPTRDGHFAVFHDWTLDCRTNGHGVTRERTLAELKALDIGYGYTADGGRTFPFRGKGVGLMPSLDEVLGTFPDRAFLINIKSNDPEEGRLLAAALKRLSPVQRHRLMVYGGDRPVAEVRRLVDVKTLSRASIKACLIRYMAYGWTGLAPKACERMVVYVPINVAPWLWGWPNRFLARMEAAGSTVFVLGPYHGGGFSSGIDSAKAVARLPEGYAGGILTNEIEKIAPLLKDGGR
ncbi:glycerophosphodiester phosphodiesterase family protein [Pedomonas mirosovicensis]|uniref:glycerophosphodiester phosphodiesterase family protein n=1 Tax=Pedomonas mirosovicensis TaxID=2908641 RepID=UPI0021671B13|nr:glycerophosphodiester phosphodiesterase family protein [Pedomonas mirosovicensis]MCH8684137.1 glycerophosphodiester phosphodiesterase [Pedomonas mirosovicensis]